MSKEKQDQNLDSRKKQEDAKRDSPYATQKDLEREVAETEMSGPRVLPADIDARIGQEDYYRFPGTTVTVCALHLTNGFVVTGESAAASMENYNEVLGRKIARANAREKIWALEGYLLRSRIAGQVQDKDPDHGKTKS